MKHGRDTASLLLFIDFIADDHFLQTNASNDDELCLALIAAAKERNTRVRNKFYFENVIPLYTLQRRDFRSHFGGYFGSSIFVAIWWLFLKTS